MLLTSPCKYSFLWSRGSSRLTQSFQNVNKIVFLIGKPKQGSSKPDSVSNPAHSKRASCISGSCIRRRRFTIKCLTTSLPPAQCSYLDPHILLHCEMHICQLFYPRQNLLLQHALSHKSNIQSTAILSNLPSVPCHGTITTHPPQILLSCRWKCLYVEQSQGLAVVPLLRLYPAFSTHGYFN